MSKFDSMLSRLSATKGVSSQETQGDRSVPQIPVRPLKKKKLTLPSHQYLSRSPYSQHFIFSLLPTFSGHFSLLHIVYLTPL